MSECKSIFGHKFRPRYDRIVDWDRLKSLGISKVTGSASDTLGSDVYVRDVCVRCGATVERQCPGGGRDG